MKLVLISGIIGSGKSSLLKNQKFLKKFPFPQKIISTDKIAKNLYSSEISGYLLQKNPYLRRIVLNTTELGYFRGCMQCAPTGNININKNKLRKYLFFSLQKTRKKYWNALESILHPQVSQKLQKILTQSAQKKGTIFVECAVPEKLSVLRFSRKFSRYHLLPNKFFALRLIKGRGLSPQEISGFLGQQR